MTDIDKIKIEIREKDCPFFTDEELEYYLEENKGNVNQTIYRCLILKSESTTLNLSGLETADTSKYFRRLAQKYRTYNSGILEA